MESLAEDLATMVLRPLTEDHVAAIRRIGTERQVAEGEIFLRTGDPADRFFYVLEGGFQLWDEARGQVLNPNILGAVRRAVPPDRYAEGRLRGDRWEQVQGGQ